MYPIAAGGKYMANLQSFFGEGDLTYTVSVDDGQAESLEGSIYQTPAPEEGQTKDLLFTASDDRTHHILLEGRTYQDFVIEDGVLKAYNGSASSVEIPYGVTTIGGGSGPVFGDTLVDVKCPATVTSIAANAFSGCTALNSFTISENVNEIGANAFAGTGLKQIEIPKTIETLDVSAFADSALQKLTLSGNTELEGNGLPKNTVVYLYSANTQAKEYCATNQIRYRVIDDTSADEEIQIIYNGVYKADLETIFGSGAWTYTVSVDGGNDTAIGEDYQLQMPASETTKRIVFSASDGETFKEHSVRLVVYKDGKSVVAEGGQADCF